MGMSQSTFELRLADHFRAQLTELSEEMNPPPHEDTLWYAGNMLARFGRSSQLFSYDQGQVSIRPLALLYKDAHEADNHRVRCLILRQLGDLALFLGALFPEKYARRGIHRDYFVGMGGGAYDYLAENAHENRHVFGELAASFTRMLGLIANACRQDTESDADILDLYQRWRQTNDPILAEKLRGLGFTLEGPDLLH